ncbi:hypothetical protein ACFW9O_19105 [Streptomyces sp. NPDC059499]|uniref:phage tail protein n=1 Tax=Streptomyces sp. NPDC059499 TaxID=3346852 RepID=UPI0036CE2D76
MALVIGDLVGLIRADDSGMRRGLATAERQMRGFRREMESNLRDLHRRFTESTRRMAEGLGDGEREGNRFGKVLGRLGGMASSLGSVAVSIGAMGAKLGAAAPVAAGLVASLANIAPAAGVAVTGLLAVVLATKALKIGMTGVDDAVKAALDPEKAEEFEKAIAKLSPSARAFAREVKKLAPEFKEMQQAVQEKLFKGFDGVLKGLAKTSLPGLRRGLEDAAGALNRMGKNVAYSVNTLSTSGALGTALKGATNGLTNLSRVPGQIVLGLGQIAAAAAPAFARLTGAAGGAFDKLSAKLTKAFESGKMERAIEHAIDIIRDVGKVVGNVLGTVGNIFKGLTANGQGLFSVLEPVTQALQDISASKGFQQALGVLSQTMRMAAETIVPLLHQGFEILSQMLQKLAKPTQELVRVLGDGLTKMWAASGPVMLKLLDALAQLVPILTPVIDLVVELAATTITALGPAFDALTLIFAALAPLVAQIATNLSTQLTPVLEAIGPVLEELLPPFVELAETLFPQLTQMLAEMTPYLADAAVKFVEMAVAMAPLVAAVISLAGKIMSDLMPVIGPVLVGLVIILTTVLGSLADFITRYVIPSVKAIGALLKGDFSGAMEHAKTMVSNFKEDALRVLGNLIPQAGGYLREFASTVGQHAKDAGGRLVKAVAKGITDAVAYVRGLPGRIIRAIPSPGSLLQGIGRAIVQGLISGIKSMLPSVQGTLADLTNMIPDWKGPEEVDKKLLVPAGQSLMGGLMGGIASQIPALRNQLGTVTGGIPSMAMAGAGGGAAAGGRVVLELRSSGSAVDDFLVDRLRGAVQVKGGGNVQVALGQGRS